MKKLSTILLISLLAVFLAAGSAMATALQLTNPRQVTIGATADASPAEELQTLMDSLPIVVDVTTDQTGVGYWQITGGNVATTAPIVEFEITSNSPTLQFGIFSDTNGDDDLAGRTLVDIFLGGASQDTSATLRFDLNTGMLEIYTSPGDASNVNEGVFSGISASGFGFYIQPEGQDLDPQETPVTGPTPDTWYSLDQLNAGDPMMVAFHDEVPNKWYLCFEDWNSVDSDWDYNDFIVSLESIQAAGVPEPATMLLLGSGLIGLAGIGRKKFFKKV